MALFLLIGGCKKTPATLDYKQMDPAFSSYIYAYSSGIVSRAAPILVRFNDMVVAAENIGEEAEKLISFSPSISGTAVWEDARTLKFTPNEPLPSQSKYEATVNLAKIYDDVPSDLKQFDFDFLTMQQHLNLNVEGLQFVDEKDLSKQQLTGFINTADFADNKKVEEAIDFSQSGNDALTVVWTHSTNQKEHKFLVDKVVRGDKAKTVNLSWNGKTIGVDQKGKEEIEIPALGDFKITNAQVVQEKEQFVLVTFSDPLQKGQNLDGLVKISNTNRNLKFTIDGNRLRVYPSSRLQGQAKMTFATGIKNSHGRSMLKSGEWDLAFEAVKPAVRLVGKGVILPNSEGLIFPFEAVSLQSVEIEIFKIYENNILQFLQNNEYGGDYNLRQVGRVVHRENVSLAAINPTAKFDIWTRYALDLGDMVKEDPAAIYQVRIGFYQKDATYPCGDDSDNAEANLTVFGEEKVNDDGEIISIWEQDRWYWDYDDYDYDHRDDPCYPPYYQTHHFISRNIFASDLGIVAKRGNDGSVFVAVSDMVSTAPMKGTSVEFYDYQQQLIASLQTDGDGIVMTDLKKKPYFVVAKNGDQHGYLKMDDGNSLSLSRFDVEGQKTYKGIKGFLYGERGVWRPGDSIYMTFILEDKMGKLPQNHPVTLEFRNPQGQLQQKITKSKHVNNMYNFATATDTEAPTGNWSAKVKVGGATFNKTIKVEAVKPNRLKIKLDFGKEELVSTDKSLNGKLQVNWLHGAPAKDLRTEIKVEMKAIPTTFPKFKEFIFDDPARKFSAEPQTIFDKSVDQDGRGNITASLESNTASPGKLKAYFTTRAFEKSGDFSTDNFSMPYNPYDSYVGIRIPRNKYGHKEMNINKDNNIEFALLDKDGKPLANKELNIGLYRISWRWWWDRSSDNVTNYNNTSHYGADQMATVSTNRKGVATWVVKPESWGRYLVRVCDPETGHCTGDKYFAGYPWGDDADENNEGATMLSFAADKKQYNVGETIKLNVPSPSKGRVLVTLENGTKVIETRWVDASKGETNITFYATEDMAPTVYAHVALLQPHSQKENDLPMRMYGVIPIRVENPATRLEPMIAMADVLKPEEKFTVKVKEKTGRAMAYTIAMVDDGLLDLTRFKTPNPWDAFYAREALGVKTWDMYDYVLGAYGGDLERILSIGGDEEADGKKGLKANRFKPVVRYYGPFYLEKGGAASHEIDMPNYVGSVRTMVVAADKGAYGNAEKTTPVRQPLMVLGTLPRVLSPTEKVKLPVTVFAMDKTIKNVSVKIEPNEFLKVSGASTQQISFNAAGDQIVEFDLDVVEAVGIGKVKIIATSGSNKATQEIELDVRNPNPYVTDVLTQVLDKGESWDQAFNLVGMKGTNSGVLEVSNIPPIDLGKRLKYLIRYPHGCIEQTTSSGFPQLYVDRLIELNDNQKKQIPENIQATVNRLRSFQVSNGGFAYWPGNSDASHWGTNYAGHFMLEAKKLGYNVPESMLNNWKKHQKSVARNWNPDLNDNGYGRRGNIELMQAYRLYTLALAGAAEMGAMNRLRERNDLSNNGKWRLAAAYAAAGKPEVAKKIINNLPTEVADYQELSYTYGSGLRDRAMILETLLLLGEKKQAAEVAKRISEELSSNKWHSTQTTAYCLLAVGKFVGDKGLTKKIQFAYNIGGKKSVDAGTKLPIFQTEFQPDDFSNKTVKVTNNSDGILYARLVLTGQPLLGDQTANSSKLNMEVAYTKLDGTPMNPDQIRQGTDFVAEVRIKNPGAFGNYQEMALSQVFPSGWEIHNARMNGVSGVKGDKPEYQDIRDDRVLSYFDIRENKGKIYRVQLNAAYQGKYFLPTTYCEAMYDNTINARLPGRWVEVLPPAKGI